MAEEAPNAALSGNRKTSMLSRISQGAAVIVQGPHGKKMERAATDMFKAIDKDGDGTITKEEFAPFYEKMREQARREAEMQERSVTKISKLQHRSRGLIAGIGAAGAFLLISVLLNFAVIFAVVDQQTPTTVPTDSPLLEVKGSDGAIVQVAQAEEAVPLAIAPLLDAPTLDHVSSLSVHLMLETASGNVSRVQVAREKFTIVGYRWFSPTEIVFFSSRGDNIYIVDGVASVVDAVGSKSFVCAANATCAAFRAAGVNVTEKLGELATAGSSAGAAAGGAAYGALADGSTRRDAAQPIRRVRGESKS